MSNPWDRQHKDGKPEKMLWFGRFNVYREMGTERTLLGAVNQTRIARNSPKNNLIPGSWKDNSKKWDWKKRAEAWDKHIQEQAQAKFKADCDEWTAGRFDDARKLREKARGYLSFPVSKRTTAGEDGNTYIIEPLPPGWAKDAAAILKIADELARITTRETLPKVETDVTSDGKPLVVNYTGNVNPDEL